METTAPAKPALYRVRVLCEHCDEIIEAWAPRVGEGMNKTDLAEFGKAILTARLLHAIMDCKEPWDRKELSPNRARRREHDDD